MPVKLLIVDDSAVVRNILKSNLERYDDIEVIGAARDPYEARDMIVQLKPDVITLDIEMPRMTGLEFIEVLMRHNPLPIIVVSSLVSGKCETSLKALEFGAVDVFAKPQMDLSRKLPLLISELHFKIIAASKARIIKKPEISRQLTNAGKNLVGSSLSEINATDKIIAIGASTGGTEAIKRVLEQLPKNMPPVIITQHMPSGFTKSFADRLNNICPNLEVREAVDNDKLYNGLALIAPGDYHLLLSRDGAKFKVNIKQGPKVSRHRPSVNVMFHSTAVCAGKNAIAVILTGMGDDGADGLLALKNKGARTIAQNEESSVVYGMPREAVLLGAAEFIEDIDNIPLKIVNLLS